MNVIAIFVGAAEAVERDKFILSFLLCTYSVTPEIKFRFNGQGEELVFKGSVVWPLWG